MDNLEKLITARHEAEAEITEALKAGQDVSGLVSISAGNTKMGKVASVSLLPILTCPGRCKGTCGDKCYAKKLAILRPTVARAYARNTAIARLAPTAFFRAVDKAMASARYFRFHVSGDIPNRSYLDMVAYLCNVHSHCQVLMFTKRYELVNQFIEDGNTLPPNLHCLFSGWTNLFPTESGYNPNRLPETTVYAKAEDIKPEWTLCGGNCLDCAIHDGGCWAAKAGETIAFKIH
jgi:hypothetical protein